MQAAWSHFSISNMHGLFTNLSSNLLHNMIIRLNYQPLFGKMSPHSPSPRVVVKSKKNILEIEKKVFSRATCASSQPASCQHFPAISHIQTGERKRLEISSTMFCHKCGREFGNNETFWKLFFRFPKYFVWISRWFLDCKLF